MPFIALEANFSLYSSIGSYNGEVTEIVAGSKNHVPAVNLVRFPVVFVEVVILICDA